jgi:hypothetical protein
MSQALDEMRKQLSEMPPLYPSRRALEATFAALTAIELRVANLEQILSRVHTARLADE